VHKQTDRQTLRKQWSLGREPTLQKFQNSQLLDLAKSIYTKSMQNCCPAENDSNINTGLKMSR